MRARLILELLSLPTPGQVDAIISIILGSETVYEANEKLKDYGIVFNDDAVLKSTGAAGRCSGSEVVLSTVLFYRKGRHFWEELLTHELVHRAQMAQAQAAGADPDKIAQGKVDAYSDEYGRVSLEKYRKDPHELQALAHTAVDAALRDGDDPGQDMRTGRLRRRASFEPGDRKRFGKYAYKALNQLRPNR